MLSNKDAAANLAVKNLDTARIFYEDTLGLTPVAAEGQELIVFRSGQTTINVYRSQCAGSNQATALTWAVGDDVEGEVRALKAKGVTFEHYDMPGMRREGDVHVGGDMKVAWFKDPDGNILNLVQSIAEGVTPDCPDVVDHNNQPTKGAYEHTSTKKTDRRKGKPHGAEPCLV